MTEKKSLKRRVRSRMAKTGERYTAARQQLLAKPGRDPEVQNVPPAIPGEAPAETIPAETIPAEPIPTAPRNEDLVVARTGRAWTQWFELLGAWGAADRSHTEIARYLYRELGVDGWWSQSITVEYEKAIGRRQVGQRADGFFVATASKTLGVPVEVAFDAFVDEATRARWLDDAPLRLRGATPNKIARFDWESGATRISVAFDRKGERRSVVALEHERLTAADRADELKAYWRERLVRLQRLLEG